MNLPSIINIELTNRCNKNCWMCGRRKIENENIYKYNRDMDFNLLEKIENQIPDWTLIQFHNNGEPLLYPRLKDVFKLFKNKIKCFDTNGKLLLEKIDELSEVDVITLSTFQDDPEWEEQYSIIKKFMELSKVRVVIRCLGNIGEERMSLYKKLNTTIVSRILHSPMGSFDYERKTTIPEHGICLEMLNHPAIDVDGNLSMCVRFDPDKIGVLGNLNDESLYNIWNSEKRKKLLSLHVDGKRGEMSFCNKCDFYGIPRGV